MGKARYQRGHSIHYSGFKLITIMFVLSVTSHPTNIALLPLLASERVEEINKQ